MKRWINADPIKERGGFNFFAFCNENPLLYIDPTGFDTVTYEFVNKSEHGAWYRFWHQPNDTIYVKSHSDILKDLKGRKYYH